MTIKRNLKNFVEKLTDTHIYRAVPRGIDVLEDVQRDLGSLSIDIVFDVGANVGQSAIEFLNRVPKCHLYCFEPVADTLRLLQAAVKRYDRVRSFRLALGSTRGMGKMLHQDSDQTACLLEASRQTPEGDPSRLEDVQIETVDHFCASESIDRINYLKIDTEGGDLEVLKGAENMLGAHRVDIVQVEAGMNPMNRTHVPFEVLKEFLESKKYFLFGVYEQMYEWPVAEPHLRRSNPVFISEPTIRSNGMCDVRHSTVRGS